MKKIQNYCKGFTLVELLVSVTIFSFVMIAMTTISLSVMKAQRVSFFKQNIQELGRFLLESMAREIRISVVNSVSGDGKTLNITNYRGSNIEYKFDSVNKRVLRGGQIISPNNIDLVGTFYVRTYSNPAHSVVTLVMKAAVSGGKQEEQQEIYLQSTVSARK
ncbi:type II secretion system GspH family protein [Patescibacteria group bacterium]|nr:type II secretion system GspH family protein [Patescibacteria group bacterium]